MTRGSRGRGPAGGGFGDVWRDAGAGSFLPDQWSFNRAGPRIEVSEDDDAYRVAAELPGLETEDIDLSVVDNALTLRGEKRLDRELPDRRPHLQERAYGAFRRSIPLSRPVDETRVQASYANGVLTVVLPKAKPGRKTVRRIPVRRG